MKICSVTLHNRTDDLALDALRSVLPHVDACVMIDTHAEPYPFTREREVAGKKLVIYRHRLLTWEDLANDVRQHSLDVAHELGFDWGIILDTDERLHFPRTVLVESQPWWIVGMFINLVAWFIALTGRINGAVNFVMWASSKRVPFDLRRHLAESKADVLIVEPIGRDYSKDRFFRLPQRGHWEWPTHECFNCSGVWELWHDDHFTEIPKSPEELRKKLESVRDVLSRYCEREKPEKPRPWEYLGHTCRELGELEAARDAYIEALKREPPVESCAWIHYCLGLLQIEAKHYDEAIVTAAMGLVQTPWNCDLSFLAAVAAANAKRYDHAFFWASHAISDGIYKGNGRQIQRAGFRNLVAAFDGPFEVQAGVLESMKQPRSAAIARQNAAKARAMREAWQSGKRNV